MKKEAKVSIDFYNMENLFLEEKNEDTVRVKIGALGEFTIPKGKFFNGVEELKSNWSDNNKSKDEEIDFEAEDIKGKILSEYNKRLETQVPIRKGCIAATQGGCFCIGACQEIIGWRDKRPGEEI